MAVEFNFKKMVARAQDKWRTMTVQEIMNLIKWVGIIALACSLGFLYFLNKGEKPKQYTAPEERNVQLTDQALNRDLDARIEARVAAAMNEYFSKVNARMGENAPSEEETTEGVETPPEGELADTDELNFEDTGEVEQGNGYPDSPSGANAATTGEQVGQVQEIPAFKPIGGISHESFVTADSTEQKDENVTVQKFKVPVGFMPAKLLVGVRAQTSQDGSSNPKPVHFRVQAPATLPNEVRMNLEGCFVIANTWGNLATERIEAELKSIHCVSRDKSMLIEGEVYGYLADTDGQRDMHGRVVTKAGALLSRQVIADILGGVGDVAANSMGTTQTSALGTVKTLDGDEMYQAGLASGVSSGFKRTSEFISNLIVQSAPIIESGAAKDVLLMIQKSSEIEVKTLTVGEL
ncbi:TraB/VirB10 family protein [Vibrio parahaemolyticus]|uniref:TraB/VirB10 family protein n=1 Tax=Vibrio parahaemolyticus TaxID=670 RepID=UPI003752F7BA|nr:TraB/VirB10 family protein [Vibrio parahaemolyticus]